MRVVFCWQTISGYMTACWRELASRPGIDLHVIAKAPGGGAAFDTSILGSVSHELFSQEQLDDPSVIVPRVRDAKPDIVVLCGWASKGWPAVARDRSFDSVGRIMAIDTPYQRTLRQHAGRLAMRSYFQRVDLCFVTGERCFELAKVLGFPETKIRRGTYGVDWNALGAAHEQRQQGAWPKKFLFAGRYAEVKAIDVLLDAYAQYRASVSDPWPLTCCGMGPLGDQVRAAEGVEDMGFVQPDDMTRVRAEHGVFVLASRFDPWPLVVVEACASGLPVICSEACGSAIELVRGHYSGMTVPTDSAPHLARALKWAHDNTGELPAFGRRARDFSAAYSAKIWADRWVSAFGELRE